MLKDPSDRVDVTPGDVAAVRPQALLSRLGSVIPAESVREASRRARVRNPADSRSEVAV